MLGGPPNYIIISSHAKYGEPRSRLLVSLKDWPLDRVIVVLNGEPVDEVYYEKVCTVRMKTNIYEYSSFFVPDILQASQDAAFMLLQDTSVAGPDFVSRAHAAFRRYRETQCDILWCSSIGQCNVCVFGLQACLCARRLWDGMLTLDKGRAISMEHNATDELSLKGAPLRHVYVEERPELRGVETPYASRILRRALYFPFLDLTKYYHTFDGCVTAHPDIP